MGLDARAVVRRVIVLVLGVTGKGPKKVGALECPVAEDVTSEDTYECSLCLTRVVMTDSGAERVAEALSCSVIEVYAPLCLPCSAALQELLRILFPGAVNIASVDGPGGKSSVDPSMN